MSNLRLQHVLFLLLAVPAALAALAACGGGGGSASPPASTGGVAGTSASMTAKPASGKGETVVVTETDYKLAFSTTKLKPGTVTFVARNEGKVAHSLEVDGPGVSHRRIAGTIAPGGSRSLTVTLKKGTYEVYCPVDSHKSLGMDAHLRVGMAGSGGGGSSGSSWG